LLLALCFIGAITYAAVQLVNSYRSDIYREEMARGTFYLMAEGYQRYEPGERDRWSQVLVEQSQIGGQLAVSHGLNQPHPNRSAAATHVEVSQTRLGALTIESKGDLADHVALNKVGIQNRAIVRLGGGDDHAEVKDSVFAGASLFDGGSEVDMLLLIGNTFASEPILENWETVTRNDAAP